jgi:hypothetical protein
MASISPCPPWCPGTHGYLYDCGGELGGDREHFLEVGRLPGERPGDTQLVVGLNAGAADEPSVMLLHLDWTGAAIEELKAGDVYLSAADAVALGPLLARAAEILSGGLAKAG